ncbi:elongation factor P [Candidatus Falkowbacteria bacterium]|nr:elongation factor P [Candidatus Falkowbacteria bacterium]
MLDMSDVKLGRVVKINNAPYVVINTNFNKTAMRKAYLITKLRNVIDGSVLEKTFTQGEKIEEADMERSKGQFLYKDADFAYFMDNNTYEQFSITRETIEEQLKYMKDNTDVDIMYFEGRPVSVTPPIKVTLLVTEAPPSVKGNSSGNITKKVLLETGAEISAPIFIEHGERIIVNTETQEYVSRAE